MPIYEYVCMNCEKHFEELVRFARTQDKTTEAADH